MNYQETLDYLFLQLPMFHRVGAAAYKADLKNTLALCEVLGHPENKFRSVHIAGTNGKGSVSSMLAAILQQAGYRTGLFTSPHLRDFRERIRIDGKMIPEEEVINFVEVYRKNFEEIQPSFFEWTAALAFQYFVKEKVEIVVLETGMGGRLDSTNVVIPELSVITNIGWDHTQFLGDTLEKIAAEKAGIIKKSIPVVIGEVQEEVASVFKEKADEMEATCVFAPVLWHAVRSQPEIPPDPKRQLLSQFLDIFYRGELLFEKLELDLTGHYQQKNILSVMQSINILREKGFHITEDNIRSGLKKVKTLTGIKGRWEILNEHPLAIADTAHNIPGLIEVIHQIEGMQFRKLHFVLGLVGDKDISGILKLLSKDAIYYFCKAHIPRGLDASELQKVALSFGLHGSIYSSVQEAYQAALHTTSEEDLVFVGGSTFVVGEVVNLSE